MVVWWWWYRVIIVSALSLSLRDKERFRDWEIERAWQLIEYIQNGSSAVNNRQTLSSRTLHNIQQNIRVYLSKHNGACFEQQKIRQILHIRYKIKKVSDFWTIRQILPEGFVWPIHNIFIKAAFNSLSIGSIYVLIYLLEQSPVKCMAQFMK